MKIAKMKTKDFIILGIIFFILHLLDIHSTYLAIKQYGIDVEANAFARYFIQEHMILGLIIKLLSALVITYVCILLNNKVRKLKGIIPTKRYVSDRKGTSIALITVTFGLLIIVLSNYSEIGFITYKGIIIVMFLTAGMLGYFT